MKKKLQFLPLQTPGLALPGPGLLQEAEETYGDETIVKTSGKDAGVLQSSPGFARMLRDILFGRKREILLSPKKNLPRLPCQIVAGHRWGDQEKTGPRVSKVMVIGKMPRGEDLTLNRCLVSDGGVFLLDECERWALNSDKFYVTHFFKCSHPEGDQKTTLSAHLTKDWDHVLQQEIALVQPKIILTLGTEPTKAILGKKAKITELIGQSVKYNYHIWENREVQSKECHVVAVPSPEHAHRSGDSRVTQEFSNAFKIFAGLIKSGGKPQTVEGDKTRPYKVQGLHALRNLHSKIKTECQHNLLAVDAEWSGDHPQSPGYFLRTIQVSWKKGTAASIILHDDRANPIYEGKQKKAAIHLMNKIFKGRILCGHFFTSDLEQMMGYGIDLRSAFEVPKTYQKYKKAVLSGKPCGFDTALAAHAMDETADLSLTSQILSHTTLGHYESEINEWKANNPHKDGYGNCPDHIIIPYGCSDADGTWRLARHYIKALESDKFGHDCWQPFWVSMRALPAVLEMSTEGMLMNLDVEQRLMHAYKDKCASVLEEIRTMLRWPNFRPSSDFEMREAFFGEQLNGKMNPEYPGQPFRLRPPGAISMYLPPVFGTDKPRMLWSEIKEKGLDKVKSPSTDKEVRSILIHEGAKAKRRDKKGRVRIVDYTPIVQKIHDYCCIEQILKSVLRPPDTDKKSGEIITDEQGKPSYSKGLRSFLCLDNKIRTHIYQTLETGRWSSARPPLQNISKNKEEEYSRVMGEDYPGPLRSIFCADPGHVIIESDYKGAELFAMAALANDPMMLEHVQRNQLDEDHPDFYDIHSNVCCFSFGYDCAPTKTGLKEIGKSHMRNVSKSVIFGLSYGRGAKAIAIGARENGVNITARDAQRIIDAIFNQYPKVKEFVETCANLANNPGWLVNSFGRYRRFPAAVNQRQMGEFGRQGKNFPLQSTVADVVSRACDHFIEYRKGCDLSYRMILQIHDAILFRVPIPEASVFIQKVIPECMVNRVPLYPVSPDGTLISKEPFRFGVDIDVYQKWAVKLDTPQLDELGIAI